MLWLLLMTCDNNKHNRMRLCEKKLNKSKSKPQSTHQSKGIESNVHPSLPFQDLTGMYPGPTALFLGGGTSPMVTQVSVGCRFVAD